MNQYPPDGGFYDVEMSYKRGNDHFGDRETVAIAQYRVKLSTEMSENSTRLLTLASFRRRTTGHRFIFLKLHLTSYRIACFVLLYQNVCKRHCLTGLVTFLAWMAFARVRDRHPRTLGERFASTRRNQWRMDLPQEGQGVAESRLAMDPRTPLEEKRCNCCCCFDMT
jgi:hypothetical protein